MPNWLNLKMLLGCGLLVALVLSGLYGYAIYWENKYNKLKVDYTDIHNKLVKEQLANKALVDINVANREIAETTINELTAQIEHKDADFKLQLQEVYKICEDYSETVNIPIEVVTEGVIDETTSQKRINARNSRLSRLNSSGVWDN